MILMSLFAAIVMGMSVRKSFCGYTNLTELEKKEDVDSAPVEYCYQEYDYVSTEINTLEELENASAIVAKVKVEEDRKIFTRGIKTKVTVQKVYKGSENIKENDSIYIYEPSTLGNDLVYECYDGYQIMQYAKEYIVFLKKLDTVEGYNYKWDEQECYLPVSALYAKYDSVYNETFLKVLDEDKLDCVDEQYLYGEIKEYPIVTYDKQELHIYKELWNRVLDTYNS